MKSRFSPVIFFLLFALSCHHRAHVTTITPGYVVMNDTVAQCDSAVRAILMPYKIGLDSVMNEVIGKTTSAMPNEKGKTETLLGNFVADVCLSRGNMAYKPADGIPADICILNNGGLRASLPNGNITRGNVFEVMPFDNEIVVVTITGKRMWELIRHVAASGGMPISGMRLGMKPDKSPGAVLIGGVTFDSTKTYKVMTSDYLAHGGDKMAFLKDPLNYETTGYLIRDAMIDAFTEKHKAGLAITPALDGRIHYENK